MTKVRTSLGRSVKHCHVSNAPCKRELTPEEVEQGRSLAREHNPKAIELSPPTNQFNCHGFAYADGHGWINFPDRFFEDDYDKVSLEFPREGDIVIYKAGGTLMHSARVTRVEGTEIVELVSKWGSLAVLAHNMTGLPVVYGEPDHLLRLRS